jgi:hypothetical protein
VEQFRFLSIHRVAFFACALVYIAGCAMKPLWPFTSRAEQPDSSPVAGLDENPFAMAVTPADGAGGDAPTVRVVRLVFDVVRADLPLGGVRDAPKIWNHVDQLQANSDGGALLIKNGMRIGVASPEAWSVIRAILDRPDIEVRRDQFVAPSGQPLAILLSAIDQDQPIFAYGPDNRLNGKTFAAGEKLLDLDYEYHPDGKTDLRLMLEVRRDLGVMRWEHNNGVIREVPAYDRDVFETLTALITLKPEEFLVVGLGSRADNPFLIGNQFLTFEKESKRFETLLFITPKAFAADVPQTARS